jgi:spermidine/putrescine transport system ATP-binding protein/putrescine transport system ATP-binding protein
MSGEDFIRIDRVTKRFPGVAAVDDATLSIRRGEFFSLLGPSGCGKTTLLRMIAGFEFPTTGEIYVDGARITDAPPNLRPSNMVFQSYAIFPHLNVFDNIAYGLRRARLGRVELANRVNAALAMIKLEGFGARRADELSGGQRQRVALARALVCRPKLLLLDEPLGALDKRLRESMQIELRQLQKRVGITFVFVTHDQEEALSMSDRVAVMSAGKILQVAAPRVLYEEPNCREVADFIGTINFFDGTVAGPDTIDAGAVGTVHAPTTSPAGTKVLVALRPEKIVLSADPVPGAIAGTVTAAAYLGERSHYTIDIPGRAEPVSVSGQNAEKIVTRGHAPGDTVYLAWAPDAVVVLPRD